MIKTDKSAFDFGGSKIEIITINTAVVGTGAAGYNAALQLHRLGRRDIAVVTEGAGCGTSRNTGSDKQTYYKLSLSGDSADSVADMARDFFAGRCVDGDHALCEAALSARCFLQLCELGVGFPSNRYGEFVGYRTDHDTRGRATSAGPLTSKMMTEALQKAVAEREIPVLDGLLAVDILKQPNGEVCGLVCLDLSGCRGSSPLVLINCKSIIWATGGPAGMYARSVYPECHHGGSGVAFAAGAGGKNLTEWQFGLASTHPRWNVSGTYMQVLPRFVSVDKSGVEREFLSEYFGDIGKMLSAVFKKGYEWPFDCNKVVGGSSVIDLLVFRETLLGRRVFLDFRSNPLGREVDYSALSPEAADYLSAAGACFGTPVERLEHMNPPAVELYASKGVDLHSEMLEIALCAQHNNGGIDVDLWWQTSVSGLFCVGEAAGTHGVCRPGGSALNAGQVGALRAAQFIAQNRGGSPMAADEFAKLAAATTARELDFCKQAVGGDTCRAFSERMSELMSEVGGAVREQGKINAALSEIRGLLDSFESVKVPCAADLQLAFRLRDSAVSRYVYLSAMADYIAHGGASRGSAIYRSGQGVLPGGLDEGFRFKPDDHALDSVVQTVAFDGKDCRCEWRSVRPVPDGGGFFENVWRGYRENKNVY